MEDVAGPTHALEAPGESHAVEPVTFEEFFEDQKERLLRIQSVITGSLPGSGWSLDGML
jgi:hypothetical protein